MALSSVNSIKNDSERFLKLTNSEEGRDLEKSKSSKNVGVKLENLTDAILNEDNDEDLQNEDDDAEELPSNLFVAYDKVSKDKKSSSDASDKNKQDNDSKADEKETKDIKEEAKDTKKKTKKTETKIKTKKIVQKLNEQPKQDLAEEITVEVPKEDTTADEAEIVKSIKKPDSSKDSVKKPEESKKAKDKAKKDVKKVETKEKSNKDEKKAETKEKAKKDEKKPETKEKAKKDEKKPETKEKKEKKTDKIEDLENEFKKNDDQDGELEDANDTDLEVKEPTKEERAKITSQMIQDNITDLTDYLADYISKDTNDICNRYIDEMPKAECIKKHKNLYSLLIARKLKPESVNDKKKQETVQSLMDSAWNFASEPYDLEKMNLKSSVEDNLNGQVTATTQDLNKPKYNEKAEKNLLEFNDKIQDLKKIVETEQKEADATNKKDIKKSEASKADKENAKDKNAKLVKKSSNDETNM